MEAKDTALLEDDVGQGVLFDQRSCMGSHGNRSLRGLSGFQGKDGFFGCDTAGDLQETGRILQRLDVHHDHFCPVILTVIIDDFVHADISLVAETGVHTDTHSDIVQMEFQRFSDSTALGNDGDVAGRHRHEGEISIDRNLRIRILNTLGVGPVDTHPVFVSDLDNLPLQFETLLTDFFKTGCVDDGKFNTFLPALFENMRYDGVLDRNVD